MNQLELRNKIDLEFKAAPIQTKDLVIHSTKECKECFYAYSELDGLNLNSSDELLAKTFAQSLRHLSNEGWKSILGGYLRYCITETARQSQTETEMLVYFLSPPESNKKSAIDSLSCLSDSQVICMIEFLEFLKQDSFWGEYFPNDLDAAIFFLRKDILKHRSPAQ